MKKSLFSLLFLLSCMLMQNTKTYAGVEKLVYGRGGYNPNSPALCPSPDNILCGKVDDNPSSQGQYPDYLEVYENGVIVSTYWGNLISVGTGNQGAIFEAQP